MTRSNKEILVQDVIVERQRATMVAVNLKANVTRLPWSVLT